MANILLILLLTMVTKNAFSYEFESSFLEKQVEHDYKIKKYDLQRFTRSANETSSTQFDCRRFANCTSCVSSEHPCIWCIESHRCTADARRNCLSDLLITGKSQESYRSGPKYCPRIASDAEFLVPAGTEKIIRVNVQIDQSFYFVQARYQCSFVIEGEQIRVDARLVGDTIYCDSVKFQYSSNAPNLTVPFNILWGRSRALDNPENVHILIYRCNALANTKENCAKLDSRLYCSWCPETSSCKAPNKCQKNISDKHGTNLVLKQDCNDFETCTSCVSTADNMTCNWCLQGNRCVSDTEPKCKEDILVNSPGFCPRFFPRVIINGEKILIPAGTNKSISVEIPLDGQFIMLTRFKCQFEIEDELKSVDAQLLGNTIYCGSFEFQYKAQVPNVTAKFSIIWGDNNALDNTNNIEVVIYRCNELAYGPRACSTLPKEYNCIWCTSSQSCEFESKCQSNQTHNVNCNEFETCTSCVTSELPCSWCIETHRCTDNTTAYCGNDILVSGSNFCQKISATNGENKIFIPAGTKKAIKFKATITSPFITQTRFMCQFNIEDIISHVHAQLLGDTIYCDAIEFQYTSNSPNITIPFAVVWGGSKIFDNPDNIEIIIYRCSQLAFRPGECSTLSDKYNCAWCTASNSCEYVTQCPSNETEIENPAHCYKFETCTSCVTSQLPCSWCVETRECTDIVSVNCRNDSLISGLNSEGSTSRSGPNFCPRISAVNGENKIFIPAGTEKAVKVNTKNLNLRIIQTRFVCTFNIEGEISHVNAQLLGDTIYCDAMEFQYTSNSPNITIPLAVVWGGLNILDNPDSIEIEIYRCNGLANSSEKCSTLPTNYNCSWCSKSNSCETKNQCI